MTIYKLYTNPYDTPPNSLWTNFVKIFCAVFVTVRFISRNFSADRFGYRGGSAFRQSPSKKEAGFWL